MYVQCTQYVQFDTTEIDFFQNRLTATFHYSF